MAKRGGVVVKVWLRDAGTGQCEDSPVFFGLISVFSHQACDDNLFTRHLGS